jgi:hypothetical protein
MVPQLIAAQEVIARMFSLHDRREIPDQLLCFSEDGVWRMSGSVVLNGRAEVEKRLTNRSKTIVTAHVVTNFTVLSASDDTISVRFYLQIYAQDDGTAKTAAVPLTTSPYVNFLSADVVKVGSQWLIKELRTDAAVFTTAG